MRFQSTLALVCVCYTLVQPVHAESLRCGSVLISEGDSSGRVIDKCGEPASKSTVEEPVWSRGARGNTYQSGTTQVELWRYTFGPGKFPAVLKIAGGVVQEITFEKTRG